MGEGFFRPLRELLIAGGCVFVRQGKGSHELWRSPITGITFSVPTTVTARPTANAILRQAGITQKL